MTLPIPTMKLNLYTPSATPNVYKKYMYLGDWNTRFGGVA